MASQLRITCGSKSEACSCGRFNSTVLLFWEWKVIFPLVNVCISQISIRFCFASSKLSIGQRLNSGFKIALTISARRKSERISISIKLLEETQAAALETSSIRVFCKLLARFIRVSIYRLFFLLREKFLLMARLRAHPIELIDIWTFRIHRRFFTETSSAIWRRLFLHASFLFSNGVAPKIENRDGGWFLWLSLSPLLNRNSIMKIWMAGETARKNEILMLTG